MYSKLLFYKKQFFVIILFLFSIIINQYYGSRGVLPMDSFFHFDSSYRILNGENPFSDFWVVSGPAVDYIQTIFFYIFGINWHSYVLHASLMNALLTLSTFFVLKNFKLNINLCFLYSIFFAILAYPSSGTPFVDHHSAFFSLMSIYSFLLAINNNKKIFWFFIPIFLCLGFLSKQVPSLYVAFFILIILFFYYLKVKKIYFIKYLMYGFFSFVLCILVFGVYKEIKFQSFIDQYIFYPQTIGSDRFSKLNFDFKNIVAHFKFIYFGILVFFYINIKKIISKKNYMKTIDFFTFLILISFTLSLIFHQLLTKNQTFIFFLIPLLTGFSHISIIGHQFKFKKIIILTLILMCLFATSKYHLRFNEGRKFHEFTNVNFNLSINAKEIDKKLSGLNWITPEYIKDPQKEINMINKIKSYLKSDPRNKMVMTNYIFLSSILDQNLFSPFRMHAGDGTSYPIKKSKYFDNYKEIIINQIKKKQISVIYTVYPLSHENIYDYIDQNCFKEFTVFEYLKGYELKLCDQMKN